MPPAPGRGAGVATASGAVAGRVLMSGGGAGERRRERPQWPRGGADIVTTPLATLARSAGLCDRPHAWPCLTAPIPLLCRRPLRPGVAGGDAWPAGSVLAFGLVVGPGSC